MGWDIAQYIIKEIIKAVENSEKAPVLPIDPSADDISNFSNGTMWLKTQ